MVEPEDQPRKIIKIKRINPRSETPSPSQDIGDSNAILSTIEESTSEVCKVYMPE